MGFPGGSVVRNPPARAGDSGLIPRSGRSPGGGHGDPLQYSGLENLMDRGAWWGCPTLSRLGGNGTAEPRVDLLWSASLFTYPTNIFFEEFD